MNLQWKFCISGDFVVVVVQLKRKFHPWLLICWHKPSVSIWKQTNQKSSRHLSVSSAPPALYFYIFTVLIKWYNAPFVNTPWVQNKIFISKISYHRQECYQFLYRKGNNYSHIRCLYTVFTWQLFPLRNDSLTDVNWEIVIPLWKEKNLPTLSKTYRFTFIYCIHVHLGTSWGCSTKLN